MDFTFNVHHYFHGDVAEKEAMLKKLDELFARLERRLVMAVRQEVKEFAAKVDAATTAIGDRIQRLIDASTSLTPDEKAELQRLSDHLDLLGHDPENPVPPLA